MEPAVDLSLHKARPSEQTLIITNQLLQATASQLNAFAATCEDKLAAMHYKMIRLEAGVKLLESKLASIPGGGMGADASAPSAPAAVSADPAAPAPGNATQTGPDPDAPATPAAPGAEAAVEAPEEPKRKIKDDPRFSKFFKMIAMGVPPPAVAMKFRTETGCDPALLDDPDAPAPPGGMEEEEDE